MEPILVPGPPKEAFDKNRRMSDLIRKQIHHFKHLEEKLPPELRATLPQHRIVTEDEAARYIAPMTRLLRSRAAAAAPPAKAPISIPPPARPRPQNQALDLAAAASPAAPSLTAKKQVTPAPKKSPPPPGPGKRKK